jgi:hypothetical protein
VDITTASTPTGVLVLRAWLEGTPPNRLRARLTTTGGVSEAEYPMAVVASVDEACEAIRSWLSAFVDDAATNR